MLHIFVSKNSFIQICVQYNDIFYLKDIETDNFQRITYDGELDQMYNGIPDWVYEGNIC